MVMYERLCCARCALPLAQKHLIGKSGYHRLTCKASHYRHLCMPSSNLTCKQLISLFVFIHRFRCLMHYLMGLVCDVFLEDPRYISLTYQNFTTPGNSK